MTVQEWLMRGDEIEKKLEAKEAEYERLLEKGTKVTAVNDGMPHATGTSDKVGNIATKRAQLYAEIQDLERECAEVEHEISEALQKLSVTECKIMVRRYFWEMTWEDIAFDLSYSRTQIWRIHQKAEKKLKDVTKCNRM